MNNPDTHETAMRAMVDKAYGRYQLDWMITHGFTLHDLMTELQSLFEEMYPDQEPISTANAVTDCYEAWESDVGFGSCSIFVCKEEFSDAEFLDRDYMQRLLTEQEYNEYLALMKGDE